MQLVFTVCGQQAVKRACCDMIPPESSLSDRLTSVSSSRLQQQDCCSCMLQATQPSVDCQQQTMIFAGDHLHCLVPLRTTITARHRRRRHRGTVPIHTRRHSAVQRLSIFPDDPAPALPGQVFLWCCPNDLE